MCIRTDHGSYIQETREQNVFHKSDMVIELLQAECLIGTWNVSDIEITLKCIL